MIGPIGGFSFFKYRSDYYDDQLFSMALRVDWLYYALFATLITSGTLSMLIYVSIFRELFRTRVALNRIHGLIILNKTKQANELTLTLGALIMANFGFLALPSLVALCIRQWTEYYSSSFLVLNIWMALNSVVDILVYIAFNRRIRMAIMVAGGRLFSTQEKWKLSNWIQLRRHPRRSRGNVWRVSGLESRTQSVIEAISYKKLAY